ncbi:MAG: endonuclease/exonuclease/phosphatase family protein [Planktomarina sp.]
MRIATYNVEWFDALFDQSGAMQADGGWSSRYNVTRKDQAMAIATVMARIDADAIMVIEAPDSSRRKKSVTALENFAEAFGLRTRAAVSGFANDTQQEITLMYDPDVISAVHAPQDTPDAPQFDQEFRIDLDNDANTDPVVWSKPPLEVRLTAQGFPDLCLIGVHAKSKAPHGASNETDAMWISIANRRKQLAQCIWLRKRVEGLVNAGHPTIVLGDFNDGPGLDKYEKLFGRSGVEIVLGEDGDMCMFDPHAAMTIANRFASPTTSRFWLRHEKRFLQALLDYIMVSPDVRQMQPAWRIWHPFEDPECFSDKALHGALLAASDHFPVTLDITAKE